MHYYAYLHFIFIVSRSANITSHEAERLGTGHWAQLSV